MLCENHSSEDPVVEDEERLLGIVSEGDLIGHANWPASSALWWQTSSMTTVLAGTTLNHTVERPAT